MNVGWSRLASTQRGAGGDVRGGARSAAAALLATVALAASPVAVAGTVQGPNNPSTIVNDPSVGGPPWFAPENADASDDQHAGFSGFPDVSSQYLKATGYGLAIPSGVTIDGIKVGVEVSAEFPCGFGVGSAEILDARIVKGGTVGATNRAPDPTFEGDEFVYGGPTDLWGEAWTASDVNAADFGFVFRVRTVGQPSCAPIVLVDVIRMSVYYTGCADGQVGSGEECDDGNLDGGDCCSPTCQFEASGSPCASDGNLCNGSETCDGQGLCQSGAALDCDDGNLCTADSCQPLTGCVNAATPAMGCRTPMKSLLILKDKSPDEKDQLIWKWIKEPPTTQAEFVVPTGTTQYALCIYSGSGPAITYVVPGDSVKWKALGDKGYKYKNVGGAADGITKVLLKGSTQNKSKCRVKGAGADLKDPALEQLDDAGLVVVQLVNDQTSVCFESTFTAADFLVADDPAQFKAKSP